MGNAADGPVVSITVAGPPTPLFEYPEQKCDSIDLPDAPARAFRDAAGTIHLFSSSHINRQLLGSSFIKLRHACAPAFKGSHDPRPEAYDDYGWLAGFFTPDGTTIYGIIHNEFHGNDRPALCKSRVYLKCWENSITAAISRDGGNSFTRLSGVIANLPYRYVGDQPHQFGYFNPTNIVHFGSYYYFFAALIDSGKNPGGPCLMRTDNIADPTSWRGWDGAGFSIKFVNPYAPMTDSPQQHVCRPIGEGRLMFSVGSVSFFAPAQTFIAIMRRQTWEHVNDGTVPGVYFATSPDLIHWSLPERLISDADVSGDPQAVLFYPAMLDPIADDRNFQDVSTHPNLLTVQFNWKTVNQARQLISRPLEIRNR